MSIKLMSAIFETEFQDLPYTKDGEERKAKASTCKLLLLAIADHANDYGESAYPGYDRLEIKTALSRQGISDTLNALKQNGLISIDDNPSRLNTNNYTILLSAFPVINSESSHLTQASQATLLGRVKPLDSNHQLTTIEPTLSAEEIKQANLKVDAIFESQRQAEEAKKQGKAWKQRSSFSFNEHVLALADKCVTRFGEPSKRDLTTWVMEIGSWVDAGARVGDWERAEAIVSGYTQPVISITGMTKAIKFSVQERKNGQTPRPVEERHPEWVPFVQPDPAQFVPMPENLRRIRSPRS